MRVVLNVVRAVPDLVYATILVAMVGVGTLPGVITLVLFDLGIVVKLVSEAVDSADASYMEAGRAAGGTQTQINRLTTLPQMWPMYASQVLYSLELNVRVSAILGIVGAGGMGRLIDEVRGFYRYDALATIILEILVVVIADRDRVELPCARGSDDRRPPSPSACPASRAGWWCTSPRCWSAPWSWSPRLGPRHRLGQARGPAVATCGTTGA